MASYISTRYGSTDWFVGTTTTTTSTASTVSIGDRVKVLCTNGLCSGLYVGMEVEVKCVDTNGTIYVFNRSDCHQGSICNCDKNHRWALEKNHYEVIKNKPKTMIKKLSNFIKKTVNADTQELLKAGLINGDLEPTVEGKNELVQIIWFANLDALVVRAKEINAEAEAKK